MDDWGYPHFRNPQVAGDELISAPPEMPNPQVLWGAEVCNETVSMAISVCTKSPPSQINRNEQLELGISVYLT